MLVAADDAGEVHPQSIQRAGVLCCVKLVSNLLSICLFEMVRIFFFMRI